MGSPSGYAYMLSKRRSTKQKTNRLKDNTKIENVGRPAAYLFTKRGGHVTKIVLCNPLPLQKL